MTDLIPFVTVHALDGTEVVLASTLDDPPLFVLATDGHATVLDAVQAARLGHALHWHAGTAVVEYRPGGDT